MPEWIRRKIFRPEFFWHNSYRIVVDLMNSVMIACYILVSTRKKYFMGL